MVVGVKVSEGNALTGVGVMIGENDVLTVVGVMIGANDARTVVGAMIGTGDALTQEVIIIESKIKAKRFMFILLSIKVIRNYPHVF